MHLTQILLYGFAIFSMFFGSGNLVFPIQIGLTCASNWLYGFLGLFVTGILLPLCGLFVIQMNRGSYRTFFREAGTFAGFLLPLFTLSLLGSFGVVPRCITVAYGGVRDTFPQLSAWGFALIFSGFTFLFCLKDRWLVNVLGRWMSPVLVASLGILIGVAWIQAPLPQSGGISASAALAQGFLTGYQTMDLFASFFFAAFIFKQIQENLAPDTPLPTVVRKAIYPSLLGAGLLGIIYGGFVFLGAHYGQSIQNTAPELLLPTIAKLTMGHQATLCIGIATVFSCVTTAIALNNIYARYLCSLFKLDPSRFWIMLAGTTGISFGISLLDFRGIAAFLSPMLAISYPGLISLTVLSLIYPSHPNSTHAKIKIGVFYLVTCGICLYKWYE
jgi:LIVCS family branched-chain amino acid:cation transporter